MSDVYQAPAAPLSSPANTSRIQQAIDGDYTFAGMKAFEEGRERSNGVKWKIQKTLLLMMLVVLVLIVVMAAVTGVAAMASPAVGGLLSTILQFAIGYVMNPLGIALFMMAVYHVSGRDFDEISLFAFMGKGVKIFLTYLLMTLLMTVGFLLLVIPGIYLAVAYMFAMILVADKDLGVWEALEVSRKAISKNWFGIFGIYLLLMVINLIAMIPLGIGLIWTVPWTLNTMAVIYRDMFGEPDAA